MVARGGSARLGSAVLELSTDDGKFTSGLANAERKAGGTFGKIGKLATAAFVGVGVAAVAGLAGAVTAAAGVEQRLDVLREISGATADEMKALGKQAKALGADMTLPGTSAADAAEAMLELSKAGLSVNDTLKASRGVLQLSAAGQLSNAAAAEITANALNAFSLEGSEAVRVADLLAASANASSASVQDVGLALKQSAAVFASAGIPIEDLVTTLGQLANAGIKGSDAGTSMRSMLVHLQAPAEQTAKIMDEIGFNIYDATGQMKSMREIIENLTASTKDMTQQERDFALAKIFGTDAVRAANVLLAQGTEGFDKMREATTKAGAAASLAASYNRGLKGAIDGLKSAAETLAITIGTPLLGPFTNLTRAFGDAVSGIEPLIERFRTGFSGGEFVERIAGAQTAAFNFGEAVRGAVEWIDRVAPSMETMKGIGAEVTGGMVEGFVLARDTLKEVYDRASEVISLAMGGEWEAAGAAMGTALLDGLMAVGDAGQRIGAAVSRWFASVNWAEMGRATAKAAIPFVAGFVMALLNPEVWARAILENKLLAAEVLLALIFMPAKWAVAIANVLRRIPLMGRVLAWVIESINGVGGPLRGYIENTVRLWGDALVGAIRRGITTSTPGLLVDILMLPTRALALLRSKGQDFALQGGVWAEMLGAGIGRAANFVLGAFGKMIDDVLIGAKMYLDDFVQIGKDIVMGLARGIAAAGPAAVGAIGGMIAGVIAKAKEQLEERSPSRVFMEIGADITRGLGIGIAQTAEEAERSMASVVDRIRGVLRDQQVGAFFGDPGGLAAVQAQQETMLAEASAIADRLMETFVLTVPEAMSIAFDHLQQTAAATAAAAKEAAAATAAAAKEAADAVIAEQERQRAALERIDTNFMMREIEAYLEGREAKLAVVKAEHEQMRRDIEATAMELVATFGIDLPTAMDKAMQHVIDSAAAMEAATEKAAEKARSVATGVGATAFNITKQLWAGAGAGTSPEAYAQMANVANQAARDLARADIAHKLATGEISVEEAQQQTAAIPAMYEVPTVKVELSADLRVAGEP